MGVFPTPTNSPILQIAAGRLKSNSVLTLSAGVSADPTGEGLSLTRHLHFRCQLRVPGCTPTPDWPTVTREFPWPLLSFSNSLEQLSAQENTLLTFTHYINRYIYPLYITRDKGYNSGTAKWKRHTGQSTGRHTELPCPLQAPHLPPSTLMCLPPQKPFKSHC